MLTSEEVAQRKRRGQEIISQRGSQHSSRANVRVLCTFNLDLIVPYFTESLSRFGISAEVACAPFGQLAQEIVDSRSLLYSTAPDVVVVVPACADLLAPLFQRPAR